MQNAECRMKKDRFLHSKSCVLRSAFCIKHSEVVPTPDPLPPTCRLGGGGLHRRFSFFLETNASSEKLPMFYQRSPEGAATMKCLHTARENGAQHIGIRDDDAQ